MAENNQTFIPEPKAWTMTNTIMAAMGALILLLMLLGINSTNTKIETGDKLMREMVSEGNKQIRDEVAAGNKAAMDQIKEIKEQHAQTNNHFLALAKDVARIDANQAARMKKEELEVLKTNGKGR